MLISDDILSLYCLFSKTESKTVQRPIIDEYQLKYSVNNATYRLLCVAMHAEHFRSVLSFCLLSHRDVPMQNR